MSQSLFLHLTTKLAWEDALAVGVYSLSPSNVAPNVYLTHGFKK